MGGVVGLRATGRVPIPPRRLTRVLSGAGPLPKFIAMRFSDWRVRFGGLWLALVFLAVPALLGPGVRAQSTDAETRALREELEKARLEIQQLKEENARLRGTAPVAAPVAQDAAVAAAAVPARQGAAGAAPANAGAITLPAPVAQGELVTVEQVLADYRASALAGDAKYKGQRLRVRGVVQGFKKNFAGLSWAVNLSSGDKLGLVRCIVSFPGISDYRPATESARILEGRRPFREWQVLLQQGEPITFEGVCTGIDDAVVVFKECRPSV